MPGRRCLCRLNQFIVHTKQEKGVSGVATSGCLAFYAGVIGVPWGWRCIIRFCSLSSEEAIGVITPRTCNQEVGGAVMLRRGWPMVGIVNQMAKIECCWHALNQNRGGTVAE